MSFSEVFELLYKNDIPLNAKICFDEEDSEKYDGYTSIGAVFYNRKENKIVFTEGICSSYGKDWELLQ